MSRSQYLIKKTILIVCKKCLFKCVIFKLSKILILEALEIQHQLSCNHVFLDFVTFWADPG